MTRMHRFALSLALGLTVAALPARAATTIYRAHLAGAAEVPPVTSTAQGDVTFEFRGDGTLRFRLIVANLENVTMAHIHMAPVGQNGDVVAWLYPAAPPPQQIPGRSSGVLAEGTIIAANLTGPLSGQSIADLIDLFDSGRAYVNVHTAAHPNGEIRGQVVKAGR